MSDPVQIGTRIRDVRKGRNWTQDQLAVAVGVSRSAVAQWETGRAGQVTGNLTRIAATLDVGVEELELLRLYRGCSFEDRQLVLRTVRRLSLKAAAKS
jgi:transcriptional regulator with XRE-family HTH domain